MDVFSIVPHGTADGRRTAPPGAAVDGHFTDLLMASLAATGLAWPALAPGLAIARHLDGGPALDPAREARALEPAAAGHEDKLPIDDDPMADEARVDEPVGEDDTVDAKASGDESVDGTKAAQAGNDGETDTGDRSTTGTDFGSAVAAMGGGLGDAGSLATHLTTVGASDTAIAAASTTIAQAMPTVPLHAASRMGAAAVVQLAQGGTRAATVTDALTAVRAATTGAVHTLPGVSVSHSRPGLQSRPSAALAPGAAIASAATQPSGLAVATLAASSAANGQGATTGTIPDTAANGAPASGPAMLAAATRDATPGGVTPSGSAATGNTATSLVGPAASGLVGPTAGEAGSLRADRPDLPTFASQPKASAGGQIQAIASTAERGDAPLGPIAPFSPRPVANFAAPRQAPMAQTVLPLTGGATGSGTAGGEAPAGFGAAAQRAGVPLAAASSPQIQRPLPLNTAAAGQISINIQRAVLSGVDRFQIRMVPAELGRVDIRLELSRGQRIKAVITVERQETLDILMRDARQLERALQQAGLNADSDSLEFTLRDGNAGGALAQGDDTGTETGPAPDDGEAGDEVAEAVPTDVISDDHVDMRV